VGAVIARVPRPGRRARYVAVKAAYGGGTFGGLLAATAGLLTAETRLARRVIGTPTATAPLAAGSYGRGRHGEPPLRLAVLGDSAAAGLGCTAADQTPGALLAGGIARDLQRRVELEVVAVVGARSADLEVQVARVLERRVDVAVLVIGANDVTHRVPVSSAARSLGRAVRALRAAGAVVVVGTCPDLGSVKPLLQPLRTVAATLSRRLAAAQTVATVEAGGVSVSLGDLLARDFIEQPHLWSEDRFHPSAHGYRRIVDAMLPSALQSLGAPAAEVSVPLGDMVQDVELAASVAAHEPGVAVEGVAADSDEPSTGRLARLVRRLPLVGRGAPAARTADEPEPAEPSIQ